MEIRSRAQHGRLCGDLLCILWGDYTVTEIQFLLHLMEKFNLLVPLPNDAEEDSDCEGVDDEERALVGGRHHTFGLVSLSVT